MVTIEVSYRFLSYWHFGSGAGLGPEADLAVVKDADGLPIVPGRTLKGLWRSACRRLLRHESDDGKKRDAPLIERAFGPDLPDPQTVDEERRYQQERGACRFDTGELERAVAADLRRTPELIPLLYRTVSSTALDESGLALPHSLRTIEVVVPATIVSTIRVPEELNGGGRDFRALLEDAVFAFRNAGLARHRGFGRVEVTFR